MGTHIAQLGEGFGFFVGDRSSSAVVQKAKMSRKNVNPFRKCRKSSTVWQYLKWDVLCLHFRVTCNLVGAQRFQAPHWIVARPLRSAHFLSLCHCTSITSKRLQLCPTQFCFSVIGCRRARASDLGCWFLQRMHSNEDRSTKS